MAAFEQRPDVQLHGSLAVRVADRMLKFRTARLLARLKSGEAEAVEPPPSTSRYDEAKAVIAIVRAHDGPSGVDAHGDAGESERLYGLSVGHVLTEQDVRDLESLIADNNDAIGHEADKWHEARLSAFREIGGEELVAAVAAKDKAFIDVATSKALEQFWKRAAALKAERPRRCDTNLVAGDGSCIMCAADQGEACRLPKTEAA